MTIFNKNRAYKIKLKEYEKFHNHERLHYYLNNPDKYLEDFNTVRILQFELSSRCNLKCAFCSHQFKENKGSDMPLGKAIEYLEKLPETAKYIHLHFSGESFLNKDAPLIIKKISNKNIYTSISTNGTLPSKRYIESLHSGLNEVIFALDGATKETHEKHRIGSNFNKIFSTLENVIKEKPEHAKIGVQYLVTIDSEKEISLMKKKLKKIRADFFNLKTISLDIASNERLEQRKNIAAYNILPKNNHLSRYNIINDRVKLKFPIIICPYPSNPVITANGDVSLCSIDIDKKVKIGNLNDYNSFDELWNTDYYRELRIKVLRKELEICKICNYSQIGLEPITL